MFIEYDIIHVHPICIYPEGGTPGTLVDELLSKLINLYSDGVVGSELFSTFIPLNQVHLFSPVFLRNHSLELETNVTLGFMFHCGIGLNCLETVDPKSFPI
jgi:hypothetical protein